MDTSLPAHQQQIADLLTAGPPEKIASDYVELVSLIVLFIVGAPLNLAAWTQIAERPVSSRLDILKKHLNYSDLLVLFIYVPSRACWLVTYDWRGGDLLCRLIKFAHTFAFQISSNVIVCIAVDRLLSVLSASHRNPEQAVRRMRLMLLFAWLAALLISAPQFAIWRSFQAFESPPWSQCMQIWEIQRAIGQRGSNGTVESVLMHEENVYVVLHMLLIFWIPAAIVLLCYLLLSAWVYINSRPNLFDLTNSGGGEKGAAANGGDAEMRQMPSTVGGDKLQQQKQQQPSVGVVLVAMRPSRVSYQLETLNTMVTNNSDAPHSKKPMIVINDDMNRPVPFCSSPSPQPMNGCPADQRNSSTTSNEAAAVLLLANRQRQSSSYSVKSQRNRAIRVSFLLVVGYFACWLPYNCLSLVQFIDPDLYHRHASKVYSLHGIIVFNSVINPYLYGLCGGLCSQRRRNS